MTWRDEARSLAEDCLAVQAGYGVEAAAAGLLDIVTRARPAGRACELGDDVLFHARWLSHALSGAEGVTLQFDANSLHRRLVALNRRASALVRAWFGQQPGWAAEEREAVLEGGMLEHLRDTREPEPACESCVHSHAGRADRAKAICRTCVAYDGEPYGYKRKPAERKEQQP